jgi:DNA-binding NarL/FixJ family response regulator
VEIKVGVVGDVCFHRECLVSRLSQDIAIPAFDLGIGDEASLALAARCDPDVILVDLPTAEACSFAEQVLDCVEGTRPIAVCRSTGVEEQVQLAEAGYVGFASATASAEELIAQIRSVMRDESQCTPQFVGALLRTIRKRTSQASNATPLGSLSQREREVAILLQNRFSNKQIAAELGIEFGTAKTMSTTF